MHQRCMTKHFVSSLAPYALGIALVACSGGGEKSDPVDTDDDQAEAQDDDSSPSKPEDVEPSADGGGSMSDAGLKADASLKPDARSTPPSSEDDDSEDDSDEDDSDEDDEDGSSDAGGGANDGGKAPDAGGKSDAGAVNDASSSTDSGRSPTPNPGGPLMDVTVNETIVVKSGETYDGTGKRLRASASALGDGSQAEGQKPVIKVENGGKLVNVTLGAPAADGIHTHGNVVLENIVWEDIGEDAMTIKEKGTVELRGGSATKAEDKVFQINAESTFRISNFKASDGGKFIRQNGKTTFKTEVFIDKCDISNMDEAIFRTDSSSSTVTMTNTRYSNIGDALFIGVSAANIKEMNNTEY
jgi:hypothetical protein